MTDKDWYDDGDYERAAKQAESMTRIGWGAIAGVTGLIGCAAIAAAVFCLLVVAAIVYLAVMG